jgi:hypothetical protein
MSALEPGWLSRVVHECHIRVMCDQHPSAVAHLGIEPRATEADATELAEKMAERFHAWTGKPLKDFLDANSCASVPSSSTDTV